MADRTVRLEQYTDVDDQHRWHVLAANNRTISAATQGYAEEADSQHAVLLTLEAILASTIPGVARHVEQYLAERNAYACDLDSGLAWGGEGRNSEASVDE